ncbi:MAG: cyclic lactone autoinducer peptide [Clostridiales bacterium]|jgi:cyclic lactone autoinducer peptide|nr:cyclic lactone autoinducer peptide [Clostridiales bacterium]
MKAMKKIAVKWGALIAAVALAVGTASVNSACVLFLHQPKVPEGMDRFKK